MALMKCPECEGNVSDKAVFCPHCGFPIAEKGTEAVYELEKGRPEYTGLAGLLRALAVISWIGVMAFDCPKEQLASSTGPILEAV